MVQFSLPAVLGIVPSATPSEGNLLIEIDLASFLFLRHSLSQAEDHQEDGKVG